MPYFMNYEDARQLNTFMGHSSTLEKVVAYLVPGAAYASMYENHQYGFVIWHSFGVLCLPRFAIARVLEHLYPKQGWNSVLCYTRI